jgi:hypothetical protein
VAVGAGVEVGTTVGVGVAAGWPQPVNSRVSAIRIASILLFIVSSIVS